MNRPQKIVLALGGVSLITAIVMAPWRFIPKPQFESAIHENYVVRGPYRNVFAGPPPDPTTFRKPDRDEPPAWTMFETDKEFIELPDEQKLVVLERWSVDCIEWTWSQNDDYKEGVKEILRSHAERTLQIRDKLAPSEAKRKADEYIVRKGERDLQRAIAKLPELEEIKALPRHRPSLDFLRYFSAIGSVTVLTFGGMVFLGSKKHSG